MKYAVAIDIGGTNTRVALIDENYVIEQRIQFPTDAQDPYVTMNKDLNHTKFTWKMAWILCGKRIRKLDS